MEETTNATNETIHVCTTTPLPITSILICASLVVLALFILTANFTVLVLVKRRIPLRTQSNICLCSLAASDFLAGFVALPLTVACSFLNCVMPQLCLAMDLCQRFLAISTIIHLLVITTERYITIVYPMVYSRILTKSRILTVLAYTWVISLFTSLIQLSWYSPEWKEISTIWNNDFIYDIFCVTVIVLLPLLFMTYAHVHILLVARQQTNAIKRQTNHLCTTANLKTARKNAQLVYAAMLGVFIAGWVPYFLLAMEADSNYTLFVLPSWFRQISLFFKFFTGLFNPLLYTFFKSDFKKEASFLYRRLKNFCCMYFCCCCIDLEISHLNPIASSHQEEHLIANQRELLVITQSETAL